MANIQKRDANLSLHQAQVRKMPGQSFAHLHRFWRSCIRENSKITPPLAKTMRIARNLPQFAAQYPGVLE
jgi:hypothetical protein